MKQVLLGLALSGMIVIAAGCASKDRSTRASRDRTARGSMIAASQMAQTPAQASIQTITRMEIDAAKQLPPERQFAVLQLLAQRPLFRPAEKQYLIEAINQLPNQDQKAELLMQMIRSENKFAAEQRRDLMRMRFAREGEEQEEMEEHGERGMGEMKCPKCRERCRMMQGCDGDKAMKCPKCGEKCPMRERGERD